MSKCIKQKIVLPTYTVGKPENLPMFFEKRPYQGASGKLYPIPYVSKISDEKVDREYTSIVLENKYIKTVLLPELGGKINSAYDKTSNYDFIYNNKVIKPAMVGLAGPWVSGGIEFNWPQHHRPTTFMPVSYKIVENKNGTSVVLGENDYFLHMKGQASISVDDNHSYIKAQITVYNSTPEAQPFMWWANMAVEVNDDYKIVFPSDVEYVNDHDRRAVLEWPIAKGVYKTARPYDYGKGTDIHFNSAVQVPSSFMISKFQSDMDYVSGYDSKKQCGVVTVANHHVAPGKKLWTWGNGKFGDKWCANLTDDGSKYVELMTGCYTDNQPDFTWIAPYESKTFEQFWYPVKDIGEVKIANIEGALNLEKRENGKAYIGYYSTSLKTVNIAVTNKKGEVVSYLEEVSPEKTFSAQFKYDGKFEDLKVTVKDGNEEIISYAPYKRGKKKPIKPRAVALPPKKIRSLEQLYLNGIHLKQYKHFAYRPEDYFLEALRRDKKDIRCNKAMGDMSFETGDYNKAISYYDRAIESLCLRNFNPYDTEPYYKRALCKFALKDYSGAYDDAYNSVWSYQNKTCGYYFLAKIEATKGNTQKAIEFLKESLKTQSDNALAIYVLGILEGNKNIDSDILVDFPLFFGDAKLEKDGIDLAIELMQFGLIEKAQSIINKCDDGAMKFYYLAYLSHLNNREEDANKYLKFADESNWECEFPNRKESLQVLEYANTPMANYYGGCILYNFERFEDASKLWEKCVEKIEFAPAYRNLSLAYYDHLENKEKAVAMLEKAFKLMPNNDRMLYELACLYKSLNYSAEKRIKFYLDNIEVTKTRDDCVLDLSVLYTVLGEYEKAEDVLKTHRFHTYEGGEGYLTQHHAWLKFMRGYKSFISNNITEAKQEFTSGLTFPENYGEEKNYFVNDAHIYYYLALIEKANGGNSYEEYLRLADSTKGIPTVHSYFECLALKEMNNFEKAELLAKEMISLGENKILNANVDDYYGVGAPAYPPFGYDISKAHTMQGNLLKAFGYLALGEKNQAQQCIDIVDGIDSANFLSYTFKVITK